MMQCDSSYILEGFRLRIRFADKVCGNGVGERKKTGEKECKSIGR